MANQNWSECCFIVVLNIYKATCRTIFWVRNHSNRTSLFFSWAPIWAQFLFFLKRSSIWKSDRCFLSNLEEPCWGTPCLRFFSWQFYSLQMVKETIHPLPSSMLLVAGLQSVWERVHLVKLSAKRPVSTARSSLRRHFQASRHASSVARSARSKLSSRQMEVKGRSRRARRLKFLDIDAAVPRYSVTEFIVCLFFIGCYLLSALSFWLKPAKYDIKTKSVDSAFYFKATSTPPPLIKKIYDRGSVKHYLIWPRHDNNLSDTKWIVRRWWRQWDMIVPKLQTTISEPFGL